MTKYREFPRDTSGRDVLDLEAPADRVEQGDVAPREAPGDGQAVDFAEAVATVSRMTTAEITRTITLSLGAVTLARLMRRENREVSDRSVAAFVNVKHVSVITWRTGEKLPEPANRARLELLFAKTDEGGMPLWRPDGRVISDLPREAWETPATTSDRPVAP